MIKNNPNYPFLLILIPSVLAGAVISWLTISNNQDNSLFAVIIAVFIVLVCIILIIYANNVLKKSIGEHTTEAAKIALDQQITDPSPDKEEPPTPETISSIETNSQKAQGKSTDSDTESDRKDSHLVEMGDINKAFGITHQMVEEHLKTVTDDTQRAATELIDEFIKIFESMKELRDIVLKEKDQSAKYSDDFIETKNKNNEMVNSIHTVLDKKLTEIQTDQELMQSLVQQAHSLSDLTYLIQNISHQTKILAINAKVVAGKSGEAGNQFAVIANEVGNLSYESSQTSKKIESAISDLISNIEKSFSQKLDDEQRQKETNILKDVNNQLTSLAADFDQLVEMHQQMLQQLDTNSKEVSDRVQESFTTIQFQDITQQQIESVVKGLSLFQQYLTDLSLDNGKETKFDIEHFQKLYVLSKQFRTHEKVVNIETFEDKDENHSHEEPDDDITFF
jgi:methyl-accepting chemotaxis protein